MISINIIAHFMFLTTRSWQWLATLIQDPCWLVSRNCLNLFLWEATRRDWRARNRLKMVKFVFLWKDQAQLPTSRFVTVSHQLGILIFSLLLCSTVCWRVQVTSICSVE